MFVVKEAETKEDLIRILQLRYKILREPWKQSIESATDDMELKSINAYIENENKEVIACGRLQEKEILTEGSPVKSGQIRFMAVSKDCQGKGLGKLIINALEKKGKDLHLKSIELQARENAVDFYKSCGYTVKEKSFLLWGIIQHYLMVKNL